MRIKDKKNLWAVFFIIIFFLAGFFLISHSSKNVKPSDSQNIYVEIGGQSVKVDLATTPAEQAQGLSGRQSLSPDEGMLFIFSQPGKYLFWMKDMNFPIDMIWITENMKVDYIEKNATPESYPATYGPGSNDGNAEYVLEVPSGFSDGNKLKVGDSVKFTFSS